MHINNLDFHKMNGVVIAVVQHYQTKAVLMVGVMTPEAVQKTFETNNVTLWTRTRQRLWTKGETSGNFLKVKEILVDCDADTLLIMAEPVGPTCHTGAESCFEQKAGTKEGRMFALEEWEKEKSFGLVLPDGSMQKKLSEVIQQAGYSFKVPNERVKIGICDDPAISSLCFQRPQEIARLVSEGKFDIGITGKDWLTESGYDLRVLGNLPISRQTNQKARIALIVSKESQYQSVSDLPNNCVIYTEYVRIAEQYLARQERPDIKVVYSFGNTEDKIVLFGAAAIVELVETGNSLIANNLTEIDLVMETEMVVINSEQAYANTYKRAKMDCFVRSLLGVLRAREYVRLEVNVTELLVDQAAKIIGGMKGATKSPITIPGWCSLVSVVPAKEQNRIISELLQIGVTDICRSEIPLVML